ncbi:MAG: ABC transporter permease [Lachnospiraceae bacterium]|nr:ABC transporter permease [Lachnospiraceae bacterium]
MLENIRQAFKGIWSHKMRSFLTMLGIIIGIAAIIAIVSTIQGSNDKIQANLIGAGNNTVKVRLSEGGYEYTIYDSSSIPAGIPQVSDAVLKKIADLDEVESVTAYTTRNISEGVYYKNQGIQDLHISGVDENYFSTCGLTLKSGRSFLPMDYENFRPVLILDDVAALTLFKDENPLGKTVEISKAPFTVVGIVTKQSSEVMIESIEDYSIYQDTSNGLIFVPKATWPVIYNYDEPENVTVRATSTDTMIKAGKKTADLLNEMVPQSSDIKYEAQDLVQQAKQLQKAKNATNQQLIWIAGISLLVGGIGVMNIMLVSVTERTAEIGLKKAIGARKKTILAQFLTEAAVLTSLGGFLGVACGIGAANVIHSITGLPVGINVPAAVIAVVFSMIIGIVFGFLPSVQAANLDPIEALRRE